jgi:hypothetical protein
MNNTRCYEEEGMQRKGRAREEEEGRAGKKKFFQDRGC